MEDVCINNKLLCNCYNRVGLPGWELKMQSTGGGGESKEMLASLEGDDTYTAPKTTA